MPMSTSRSVRWRLCLSGMLATAIMAVVAACIKLPTPHENFKDGIGGRLGHNINAFRPSSPMLSSTRLPNGHVEMEFWLRGTCRYFYEVAPDGTIVAWRFVGTEKDCIIVPQRRDRLRSGSGFGFLVIGWTEVA